MSDIDALRKHTSYEGWAGLGAFHFAQKLTGWTVVGAGDINGGLNELYLANHNLHMSQTDLTDPASWAKIAALRPSVLTFSPECQPFASRGRGYGWADARASSTAVVPVIAFYTQVPGAFGETVGNFANDTRYWPVWADMWKVAGFAIERRIESLDQVWPMKRQRVLRCRSQLKLLCLPCCQRHRFRLSGPPTKTGDAAVFPCVPLTRESLRGSLIIMH